MPAELPAGNGCSCYLPRRTAPRDSELLLELELFPEEEEEDEAEEDDLPADGVEDLDSDLAEERALAEELDWLRTTAPDPLSRVDEDGEL